MWTCPNCETINDGEFCVVCGEKYEENKYGPERENIIADNDEKKNICPVCGAGNSDAAVYCWKCGKLLEKEQKPWVKSVAIILLGIVFLMLICNGLGLCAGAEEYAVEATEAPYYYEDSYADEVATEEAVEEAYEDYSYYYNSEDAE